MQPLAILAILLFAAANPATGQAGEDERLRQYEQRNLAARTAAAQTETAAGAPAATPRGGGLPVVSSSVGYGARSGGSTGEPVRLDLRLDLPDPTEVSAVHAWRYEQLSEKLRNDVRRTDRKTGRIMGVYPSTETYVAEIARPKQARLSLDECIRRTLANNYQIRAQGYAPAISAAQIVQAEAAFDAAVFGAISRDDRDQPVVAQIQAGRSETYAYAAGVRQLLPTGANISVTQALGWADFPGFQFQLINPSYTANFIVELRQPLMRNFGMDFNRAGIDVAKNNRNISLETFRRTIMDRLNEAEAAYWALFGARRAVVIAAEWLAQAERTLEQVEARQDYDAFATLVANSKSQVEQRRSDFIRIKNSVFDAEDNLRNLMNARDLNLAESIELIPLDSPVTIRVVRDNFREVEIALDRRPEIREARLAVENARIQLGVAKNQALPSLDLVFRRTISGLGDNFDNAFDQMTTSRFIDNFFSLEFAWNFAERGERAGIRIAALQQSQAVAQFKLALDNVITDCRVRLRALNTSLEQIGPNTEALLAARDNLRSIQERAESKSPEQLNTIFQAQSQLAQTRNTLLQSIVTYNTSIVELERAKGTLLEYDNITVSEEP